MQGPQLPAANGGQSVSTGGNSGYVTSPSGQVTPITNGQAGQTIQPQHGNGNIAPGPSQPQSAAEAAIIPSVSIPAPPKSLVVGSGGKLPGGSTLSYNVNQGYYEVIDKNGNSTPAKDYAASNPSYAGLAGMSAEGQLSATTSVQAQLDEYSRLAAQKYPTSSGSQKKYLDYLIKNQLPLDIARMGLSAEEYKASVADLTPEEKAALRQDYANARAAEAATAGVEAFRMPAMIPTMGIVSGEQTYAYTGKEQASMLSLQPGDVTYTVDENGNTVSVEKSLRLGPNGYDPIKGRAERNRQLIEASPLGLVIGPLVSLNTGAQKMRAAYKSAPKAESLLDVGTLLASPTIGANKGIFATPTNRPISAAASDVLKNDVPLLSGFYQGGKAAVKGDIVGFNQNTPFINILYPAASALKSGDTTLAGASILGVAATVGLMEIGGGKGSEGKVSSSFKAGEGLSMLDDVVQAPKISYGKSSFSTVTRAEESGSATGTSMLTESVTARSGSVAVTRTYTVRSMLESAPNEAKAGVIDVTIRTTGEASSMLSKADRVSTSPTSGASDFAKKSNLEVTPTNTEGSAIFEGQSTATETFGGRGQRTIGPRGTGRPAPLPQKVTESSIEGVIKNNPKSSMIPATEVINRASPKGEVFEKQASMLETSQTARGSAEARGIQTFKFNRVVNKDLLDLKNTVEQHPMTDFPKTSRTAESMLNYSPENIAVRETSRVTTRAPNKISEVVEMREMGVNTPLEQTFKKGNKTFTRGMLEKAARREDVTRLLEERNSLLEQTKVAPRGRATASGGKATSMVEMKQLIEQQAGSLLKAEIQSIREAQAAVARSELLEITKKQAGEQVAKSEGKSMLDTTKSESQTAKSGLVERGATESMLASSLKLSLAGETKTSTRSVTKPQSILKTETNQAQVQKIAQKQSSMLKTETTTLQKTTFLTATATAMPNVPVSDFFDLPPRPTGGGGGGGGGGLPFMLPGGSDSDPFRMKTRRVASIAFVTNKLRGPGGLLGIGSKKKPRSML